MHKLIQLLLLSLMLLTACGPAPAATSAPAVTNTYRFKPLPATWTPSPTDITPSLTSSQTFTPSLTYTPTSTKPPTLTPLPTLTSAEAQKMLNYMINQNGGCKLPCWWGITPGVTKSDDMVNFLGTLINIINSHESSYFDQEGEKEALRTVVFYDPKDETLDHIFEVVSVNGTVKRIEVYQDLTSHFTLANLLSVYGPPTEIFVATEPASPINRVPFALIMVFQNKGIVAYFYSGLGGKISGNFITICPQNILPMLHLWSYDEPQQSKFEVEYLKDEMNFQLSGMNFKPIETISNLSIDSFYRIFRQKDNSICITSESEQWWTNPATYVPPVYDTSTPTLVDPFIETAIPTP